MKKIIFILLIFIHYDQTLVAQPRFELNRIINVYNQQEVIFYNFLRNNNDLLIGSSVGVFQINNDKLLNISSIPGPIGLVDRKIVEIARGEINRSLEYTYLLEPHFKSTPVPTIIYNNKLYLIVDGKIRVYLDKKSHKTFEGLSVRSISENFIGTYQGIFQKSSKNIVSDIQTNSYLREINNSLFVCYSGLAIIKGKEEILFRNNLEELEILGKSYGFIVDITTYREKYILFSTKGIYITDLENFIQPIAIPENESDPYNRTNWPKYVFSYIDKGYNDHLLFCLENKIYRYYFETNSLQLYAKLEGEIKYITTYEDHIYVLNQNDLRKIRQGKNDFIILKNTNNFHSFLPLNNNRILLFSDFGIFIHDFLNSLTTSISAEEVNFGAVYSDTDSISIGGVNGITTYKINDLENMVFPITEKNSPRRTNYYFIIGIIALLVFSIYLFMIKKSSKPTIIVSNDIDLKKSIDQYIDDNLEKITIDSITEEYKISYTKLKRMYQPTTIGKLITNKRQKLLLELLDNQEHLSDISRKTGYSITYLKKLISLKKKE